MSPRILFLTTTLWSLETAKALQLMSSTRNIYAIRAQGWARAGGPLGSGDAALQKTSSKLTGRCARAHTSRNQDAKEEKRSKSARFKKSSEEIGAKGLQKVLNTADTDTHTGNIATQS